MNDINSEDNPLSGKNTDERIIMCLEEEYPEHDFVVVESFNKENDFGKFEDENGIEFTVHGLVYDNTYHFGCRNDYLKVLLESQDYLNKVSDIAEEYGFNVDYSEETIGIEGDENKDSSDSIVRISEMIQNNPPRLCRRISLGSRTGLGFVWLYHDVPRSSETDLSRTG